MAREFAKSEIIRQKCSICGMKNKLYTELIWNDKKCGYKLTCCNCSHIDTFLDDETTAILKFTKGREICIQPTTCKHKTCKYYGKYTLGEAAKLLDASLQSEVSTEETSCDCGTELCQHKIQLNIGNLNGGELDINDYELYNRRFH